MVFGFGRKKKQNTDSDSNKTSDKNNQNTADSKQQRVSLPHRRGSMGSIQTDAAAFSRVNDNGPDNNSASFSSAPSQSQQQSQQQLSIDDIPLTLSQFDSQMQQHTISAIRDIRNKAEPMIEELIQMGRDLEQDDLNIDSIDKHLGIIVVRGKKQVIDIIRRGVTRLPDANSIEDAMKIESVLRQILKKVGDVLGRQTRVIHIFAKKHANKFKDNLAVMNSQHAEIRDILNKYNKTNSDSQHISDALTRIKQRQGNHTKRLQKISDISSDTEELKSKTSGIKSSISEIKSSSSYAEHVRLLAEIRNCDLQLRRIRAEINSQFAKISRPLGRYEYGSSLDKSQQKILANLVADPASVVHPSNVDTISTILSNVRRAVASGSISVKDLEKTIAMLAETADAVGQFASNVAESEKQHKDLLALSKSAKPAGLDEYERNLSKSVALIDDNLARLSALRTEIQEDNVAIPDMISEIQILLRQHTGTQYEILHTDS